MGSMTVMGWRLHIKSGYLRTSLYSYVLEDYIFYIDLSNCTSLAYKRWIDLGMAQLIELDPCTLDPLNPPPHLAHTYQHVITRFTSLGMCTSLILSIS